MGVGGVLKLTKIEYGQCMRKILFLSLTALLLSLFATSNANAAIKNKTPTPLKQIQPTPKQPSFKNPMSQKDFDKCMSTATENRKCATGR